MLVLQGHCPLVFGPLLFEYHTCSQRLLEIENYFIELCDGVSATQVKEATEEEGAEEV